jgi:hypothetical protein
MAANLEHRNFRVFGPDETASNRLEAQYEATGKTWEERTLPVDENLATDGRVMEILSEHTCEGWLEGYLLTGRHGFISCYEAFIHIVDSMFNQHAKWLKVSCNGLPAAGHQHPALGGCSLPAQPGLRQRDRGGLAAGGRLAGHGRRGAALHQGRRDLGVGQYRQRWFWPGRGAGVRRGRADA